VSSGVPTPPASISLSRPDGAPLLRSFTAALAQIDEAPACMRCRGLARPVSDTPPIAPAGWSAGAIGEPDAVRPTTGPGHLPEVRLPVPPASPGATPWSSRSPPRSSEPPAARSCLQVAGAVPSGPGTSSRLPGVTPRTPEVCSG